MELSIPKSEKFLGETFRALKMKKASQKKNLCFRK